MLMGTIAGSLCSFFVGENDIYKGENDIRFVMDKVRKKEKDKMA